MGEPRIIELTPRPLPKDLTPNVFAAECPTRRVLDRVADKWAVLILILLADGTKRFNALKRMIGGVSQKMLSQTLKSLERDGLVSRKVIPTVPVTVEYSITPLGRTLHAAVDPLRIWAETHIAAVEAAQARYDAEAGQRG
ncbi:winged helix-turn-helix transcriptional regulator [Phreatobacter oligotrophus]|jgi:DNA-binding HxlR family transcriptional regulator|uniref:winged helix-turn-helix transcriptional regulator n=1 Tax=Phreatobacter oligotrophus TaxID=1122261 RepID=UPI002357CA10|nr:helix-turn-helix domain-containing protein [Phreatobacter oligotrophus]MBX9988999.1 helix-turn-helix transcriptional regulator [Phreatobacter oligotrophus]